MKHPFIALGIMTGNSLDAIDTVITFFGADGKIHDLFHGSSPFPDELANLFRTFREELRGRDSDIPAAERALCERLGNPHALEVLHNKYISVVADACRTTIERARAAGALKPEESPDIVGFHGQTCAHRPPSIARQLGGAPYTVQFGNGQLLSDLLDIPVAYDFRSDDLINGGEGAPLAPMHHTHLAQVTKTSGAFPIAFINGGNTGNVSIITHQLGKKDFTVRGWDTGPFNHLPDLLARREANSSHDIDGTIGETGTVNRSLIRLLYNHAAVTADGSNFFLQPPPRSSDPQWYREIPELLGLAPVDGEVLSLPDRMRTAEYFSAYTVMLSLALLPDDCEAPAFIGLCGGGWKNKVVRDHFRALMLHTTKQVILEEHRSAYQKVLERFSTKKLTVELTSAYGLDPHSMEARIFADAAVHLVWAEPFTLTSITGVKSPTICGQIRFPQGQNPRDFKVGNFMAREGAFLDSRMTGGFRDVRFGRAIPGWEKMMKPDAS